MRVIYAGMSVFPEIDYTKDFECISSVHLFTTSTTNIVPKDESCWRSGETMQILGW